MGGAKEGFIDALFDPEMSPPPFKPSSRADLWKRVVRGGYPEPFARAQAERRRAWVDSYVATIIQRDVQDLANIEGLTVLPRLLGLLAARSAGLMNYAELSRTMGLPQTTLKRYLALLEATFLSHPVPPWSGNLGKRLVKAPKLFLNDAGLAAALLAVDAERLGADGALAGPLLETFVMTELAKQASWSRTRPRLHHFRTQAGAEVDFILEDSRGRCVGVEVKAGGVGTGDFKGLKALSEIMGKRFVRGVVLSSSPETTPFARNLHALPVGALWQFRAEA